MAKPTILPIWNTDETNSTEPDAAHKLDGWLAPGGVPEKPPFQTFNFWQNSVYKWIAWIEEFFNPSLDKSVVHNITVNADYTLTADQILHSRIEITDTGVLLSTGRNIIVDNIEHTFVFVNSTLQTLTIKTPTGTGISISAGESRKVRNDTINVILHEEIYGIGVDQTWQDLTGSRTAGVTYTNTTGKPIEISISSGTPTGTPATFDITISGVSVAGVSTTTSTYRFISTHIVPPGATYVVTITAPMVISKWSELR